MEVLVSNRNRQRVNNTKAPAIIFVFIIIIFTGTQFPNLENKDVGDIGCCNPFLLCCLMQTWLGIQCCVWSLSISSEAGTGEGIKSSLSL